MVAHSFHKGNGQGASTERYKQRQAQSFRVLEFLPSFSYLMVANKDAIGDTVGRKHAPSASSTISASAT